LAGLYLLVMAACVPMACAPRGARPAAAAGGAVMLRLLGAAVYPAGTLTIPGEPRFGSVSGLAFDGATGQWVGASDDISEPRLTWMDIALGPALSVTLRRFTFLRAGPGVAGDVLARLDMESLVPMPDGGFAATNEGHTDPNGFVHQPVVLLLQRDGRVTGVVQPPAHYTMVAGDRTTGVTHNQGLESLTRTPDGRLLSGLEQPLLQDGAVSSATRGAVVRLLEFVERPRTGWTPGREWAYQLEPTPAVPGYHRVCEDGENGLSDMLALANDRWLMLERACLLGAPGAPAYNPTSLFEVTRGDAEDIASLPSLAGRQPRLVRKRLVLDAATLIPLLPPRLSTLANFEGLAFGPPGPRGERTVMLVSDDNYRDTQTTAFLWLALDK
jgi:Esterase-like activity of phytase